MIRVAKKIGRKIIFSNDSLHHWEDPKQAFSEIERIVKPNGNIYIRDSRRDLKFFGKFILYGLERLIAGKMWKYWHSSIEASYTPEEITEIIQKSMNNKWKVVGVIMDLCIFS